MTLNPDQFHEHLDRLSEASGLQYGPNSISTSSGIVLPAMHRFEYSNDHYGPVEDELITNSLIPDERGTVHRFTAQTSRARPEIASFYGDTVEADPQYYNREAVITNNYEVSEYGKRLGEEGYNRGFLRHPEEILERFKSEPFRSSQETESLARSIVEKHQQHNLDLGVQPHEAHVQDFSSVLGKRPPSFAYDFRSRSMRPL